MKEKIQFKGNQEGIYLLIEDGNFRSLEKELDSRLKKSNDFFKGAKIVGIEAEHLSLMEKFSLLSTAKYRYNLDVKDIAFDKVTEEEKSKLLKESFLDFKFEGIYEGNTKFVNHTLRSGQKIDFHGNVVIIGDVNPGAHIVAKGNIVVLGRLKGIAHAGSNGNKGAVVAAYDLQPTQLRIADKITRKPDGKVVKDDGPEIASIVEEQIYIESYLSKK